LKTVGAHAKQQILLFPAASDIDQADVFLLAEPDQHLAEVARRDRMHKRLVPLLAHDVDHAQRGQGIDEDCGAVGGRTPLWKRDALGGPAWPASRQQESLRLRRSPLPSRTLGRS
jgi:hypothetical protein